MDNKVQKIKIDEDISTKIEALQYEIDTRKDVIAFMIASDMNMETDLFEGAIVMLAIKVKEGGVYPHAIRVLKNGEPFNPFECFDN